MVGKRAPSDRVSCPRERKKGRAFVTSDSGTLPCTGSRASNALAETVLAKGSVHSIDLQELSRAPRGDHPCGAPAGPGRGAPLRRGLHRFR